MADSSSSQYDQESKEECQSRLIEHAVRCLTEERSNSVCVKRDHVERVWKRLFESRKDDKYFTENRQEIVKAIHEWEMFYDGHVHPLKNDDERKTTAAELRVCYLCGENTIIDDLDVLVKNGVPYQNVWAIDKHSKIVVEARKAIKNSQLRNVKLYKVDILDFLKDFQGGPFDIIYLDTCGALPSEEEATLKIIGHVFLYNRLTSPGALITNFSFPPPQDIACDTERLEREKINFLVKEYMKYRLCNLSPEN